MYFSSRRIAEELNNPDCIRSPNVQATPKARSRFLSLAAMSEIESHAKTQRR
ncbi:hypothetical protein [Iningainema tapete]|uniref:Uncharacterized protein n=1 Tax=Iningainema tapete BLCC-T55 TaxID=2748662 RepID=A0A8J6XP84_9CYAN|nr:hypothetical protein [Iningainema tapete]MBD2776907.1 hypothetical protein [Iningainema tapete BLCC-T55]